MSPESPVARPSPFNVTLDFKPDAVVARCDGRLTGQNGDVLRSQVRPCIKPGAPIVLDLTDVTHCDSMGLAAVISLYASSRSASCRLEVINLAQNVRQLFSMANVLSLFEAAADGMSHMR